MHRIVTRICISSLGMRGNRFVSARQDKLGTTWKSVPKNDTVYFFMRVHCTWLHVECLALHVVHELINYYCCATGGGFAPAV
jgi:hypothetical protein